MTHTDKQSSLTATADAEQQDTPDLLSDATLENKVDAVDATADKVEEIGGPKGLEPTRYGDWESKGRCYDF